MVELDEFYNDIIKLSNSLVIKMKDVAIANNNYSLSKGVYVNPVDVKTWRYFMNLAGEKHPSNNDVQIVLMETGTTVSYSKEILDTHPFTRRELLKNEEYYNLLVNKYPEDLLYIHGCLYPVDKSVAIDAEDGAILAYNKTFVEDSELSLIRELELFTINFVRRWYNSDITIVENLFLPAFLSVFYSSIPNKIFNIRLDKVFTNEVHSFHLEHFFRSKYDIWNNVQVLNKQSLYWLYRNMNYLRKHVGKQKTFDIILDKIYDANSVGVGEYLIRIPDADIEEENEDNLTKSSFTRGDASSITTALNRNYILDNNEEVPITTLVGMELDTTKDVMTISQEMSNFIQNETAKTMQSNLQDNVKTKTLDINGLKLFKTNGTDIVTLALDYWMYSLKNGNFNSILLGTDENDKEIWEEPVIEYIEPNNKKVYNVKPSVGYLMVLKVLLMITKNINKKIRTTTYTSLLKTDKDVLDNLEPMFDGDGYIQGLIGTIKETLPISLGKVTSPEVFGDHLNYVFKFHEYLWTLDSNSENILVSANLKIIFNRLRTRGKYTVSSTNRTIDQILEEHGVEYVLNEDFNLQESFYALIKTFTTLFVDPYEVIRNNMIDYVEILNKITSYTTHTVMSSRDDTANTLYYNNLGVLLSKTGIVNLTRGELIPNAHVYCKVKAAGNDFSDYGVGSYDELFFYLRACKGPEVIGYWDNVEYFDAPKVMLSKTTISDYFINRCNCKNIFITGVTSVWHPSAHVDAETKMASNNDIDIMEATINLRTMFLHKYDLSIDVLAYRMDIYNNISSPIIYGSKYEIPYKLLYGMETFNRDAVLLSKVTAIWYPYGLDETDSKTESNGNIDELLVNIALDTMSLKSTPLKRGIDKITTVWNTNNTSEAITDAVNCYFPNEYSSSVIPTTMKLIKTEVNRLFDAVSMLYNPATYSNHLTQAANDYNMDMMVASYDNIVEYKFTSTTKDIVTIKSTTVCYSQDTINGILLSDSNDLPNTIIGSIDDHIPAMGLFHKLESRMIDTPSMITNVTLHHGLHGFDGSMKSSSNDQTDILKGSINTEPNITVSNTPLEINGIKMVSMLNNYSHSDYTKVTNEDNNVIAMNSMLKNIDIPKSNLTDMYTQTISDAIMKSYANDDSDTYSSSYLGDANVNVVINKRRVKKQGLRMLGYTKVNGRYVKEITTSLDSVVSSNSKAAYRESINTGVTSANSGLQVKLEAFSDSNEIVDGITTGLNPLDEFQIPEPVMKSIRVIKDTTDG